MKEKKNKPVQYTIRGVSERTDRLIREKAEEYGISLNEATLKVLQSGTGQDGGTLHRDFDAFAGTWVEDPVFDQVVKDFSRIDEEMWP